VTIGKDAWRNWINLAPSRLEELVVSSLAISDPLAKLLIEKGVITAR
jgi:hypothetical protein